MNLRLYIVIDYIKKKHKQYTDVHNIIYIKHFFFFKHVSYLKHENIIHIKMYLNSIFIGTYYNCSYIL